MRLIDADELYEAINDASNDDEWDISLDRGVIFAMETIHDAPTIEPNLVLNPDEIERGDVVEIGENIVVMHHDDYYDMFLKSELYDDIKPCEDAISREVAIEQIVNTPTTNQDKGQDYLEGSATRQNEIIDILKSLPPVAPSRRGGDWIDLFEEIGDTYDTIGEGAETNAFNRGIEACAEIVRRFFGLDMRQEKR